VRCLWVALGVTFTLNLVAAVPPTRTFASCSRWPGGLGIVGSVAMIAVVLLILKSMRLGRRRHDVGATPGERSDDRRVWWVPRGHVSLVGMAAVYCALIVYAGLAQPPVEFAPPRDWLSLEIVANGFREPTALTSGSGDIFVAERRGRIVTLDGSTVLDIADRVRFDGIEEGLIGIAAQPSSLYVHYIDRSRANVLSVFGLSNRVADPLSERVIWRLQDDVDVHNGGGVALWDGQIYIGIGDGRNDADPRGPGRPPPYGSVLRFDPTRSDAPTIWAVGLRNPWQISFDQATGDLWIPDAGSRHREEVNRLPAGAPAGTDFGWPDLEGSLCRIDCGRTGLTSPVAEYRHQYGRCAVVGGVLYRGVTLPELSGRYLFSDWCTGSIWSVVVNEKPRLEVASGWIVNAFGVDPAGEAYVLSMDGRVGRVVASP
jgi:glucose/arabinose dehydrogenase